MVSSKVIYILMVLYIGPNRAAMSSAEFESHALCVLAGRVVRDEFVEADYGRESRVMTLCLPKGAEDKKDKDSANR